MNQPNNTLSASFPQPVNMSSDVVGINAGAPAASFYPWMAAAGAGTGLVPVPILQPTAALNPLTGAPLMTFVPSVALAPFGAFGFPAPTQTPQALVSPLATLEAAALYSGNNMNTNRTQALFQMAVPSSVTLEKEQNITTESTRNLEAISKQNPTPDALLSSTGVSWSNTMFPYPFYPSLDFSQKQVSAQSISAEPLVLMTQNTTGINVSEQVSPRRNETHEAMQFSLTESSDSTGQESRSAPQPASTPGISALMSAIKIGACGGGQSGVAVGAIQKSTHAPACPIRRAYHSHSGRKLHLSESVARTHLDCTHTKKHSHQTFERRLTLHSSNTARYAPYLDCNAEAYSPSSRWSAGSHAQEEMRSRGRRPKHSHSFNSHGSGRHSWHVLNTPSRTDSICHGTHKRPSSPTGKVERASYEGAGNVLVSGPQGQLLPTKGSLVAGGQTLYESKGNKRTVVDEVEAHFKRSLTRMQCSSKGEQAVMQNQTQAQSTQIAAIAASLREHDRETGVAHVRSTPSSLAFASKNNLQIDIIQHSKDLVEQHFEKSLAAFRKDLTQEESHNTGRTAKEAQGARFRFSADSGRGSTVDRCTFPSPRGMQKTSIASTGSCANSLSDTVTLELGSEVTDSAFTTQRSRYRSHTHTDLITYPFQVGQATEINSPTPLVKHRASVDIMAARGTYKTCHSAPSPRHSRSHSIYELSLCEELPCSSCPLDMDKHEHEHEHEPPMDLSHSTKRSNTVSKLQSFMEPSDSECGKLLGSRDQAQSTDECRGGQSEQTHMEMWTCTEF